MGRCSDFWGIGKQAQRTGTGRLPEVAAEKKGVFQYESEQMEIKGFGGDAVGFDAGFLRRAFRGGKGDQTDII